MEVLKWKICNYLLQLSKITVEFNRLGKYYQTDMKGPWILLNYILSTDIAVYALTNSDLLRPRHHRPPAPMPIVEVKHSRGPEDDKT